MPSSKRTLPQVSPEVSIDDLGPETSEPYERAVELAEVERAGHKGQRRRWSKDGTLSAELVVQAVSDELLQLALEEHAYNHRLFRAFHCSPRCRACDMWATVGLLFKTISPSKDWPIRQLLAPIVKEATGYDIRDPGDFAHQVDRDLLKLPVALVTPRRKRTAAQRRLLAIYNVTTQRLKRIKLSLSTGGDDIETK